MSVIGRLAAPFSRARRDEARWLASLAEQAPMAILHAEPHGAIVRVNARWSELSGLNPAESLGMGWTRAIHPDDREGVERLATASEGHGWDAEVRLVRPDGTIIWVALHAVTIRDESGAIAGHLATALDITPRHRELQVREAHHRLARVLAWSPPVESAMPEILEALCEALRFDAGAFWQPEGTAGLQRRTVFKHGPEPPADGGLARSAAEARQVSMLDEAAATSELAGGIALPLIRHGEVLGVLEFFRVRALPRDHDTSEALAVAATQVAHFLERKQDEVKLRWLADHDPLTGLFNRRRFHEELERQLARDDRTGSVSALLLVDLDHFKTVNDTHGHSAGDEVIVSVACALDGRLRDTDVLGRLGGDELAILLPDTSEEAATRVAHELVELVRQQTISVDGQHVRMTASIGVAIRPPAVEGSPGRSADELLVAADLALYSAKDAGRDRAVIGAGARRGLRRLPAAPSGAVAQG